MSRNSRNLIPYQLRSILVIREELKFYSVQEKEEGR